MEWYILAVAAGSVGFLVWNVIDTFRHMKRLHEMKKLNRFLEKSRGRREGGSND